MSDREPARLTALVAIADGAADGGERTASPGWLETWSEVVAAAGECHDAGPDFWRDLGFVDQTDLLPFEEILVPFVLAGRQRLRAGPGMAGGVEPEVFPQLERLLLLRLTSLAARSLLIEFSAFRWQAQSPLERLVDRVARNAGREVYTAFVQHMLGERFVPFFREHPVLARLAARVSELWVEATNDFLERLERDHDEISRTFSPTAPIGTVASLVPGLSDPHAGGRMVSEITFTSGVKIAYKPKDIGTELAFSRLLTWLNARGGPLPLRALKVLACQGYGWVEWAAHTPCCDEEQVRDYYRRAGMLLCLLYLLGGTDCHRENLVASGEHPVLVDAESLMHHRVVPEAEPPEAFEVALDELRGGVLGTGLLPSWRIDVEDDGETVWDISALHTGDGRETVVETARWDDVNTDRMAIRWGPVTIDTQNNQPYLGNTPVRLEDYADSLLEGFEQCYRFLGRCATEILAPGGPIEDLSRQHVRFLFRNTRIYADLHRQLTDPRYMRDVRRRRAELERLTAALEEVPATSREAFRRVVDAEMDAMEDMDIPYFWARADSAVLHAASESPIEGCLREPSSDLVVGRLRNLSVHDMERQLGFIAGSLHANSARHDRRDGQARPRSRLSTPAPGPVDLNLAALQVAEEIASRSIRSTAGGATWIAPQYLPRLERYQLQPVGYDLHSGACGLALFLASVDMVTGEDRYSELILEALKPLRTAIADDPTVLVKGLGFGAATGVGSVVYALTRIGGLLEDPAMLRDATAVAELLDDETIAASPLDVFSGLAGDILGLLSLHRSVEDRCVLEGAVRCGRRLLREIRPAPEGGRAWPTFKGRMLTGFSHGAAGIAYALVRLYAETGDDGFRLAAIDAITYETTCFDPHSDNWRDLREDAQPAYKCAWCHGAPGIGLARLGGLPYLDAPQVRTDIDVAIRRTLSIDLDGPDHLCCGNVGRIELLLKAGGELNPELSHTARELIEVIVGRFHAEGRFSMHTSLPARVEMPGLFMGTSGIGYQILRTAHPDLVPSVLLWE